MKSKTKTKTKAKFKFYGTFRKMYRAQIYRHGKWSPCKWRFSLKEALDDIQCHFNLHDDWTTYTPWIEETYRMCDTCNIESYSNEKIKLTDFWYDNSYDTEFHVIDEKNNVICKSEKRYVPPSNSKTSKSHDTFIINNSSSSIAKSDYSNEDHYFGYACWKAAGN